MKISKKQKNQKVAEKAVLTLGQRGAVKVLLCSTLLAY
jgi:hypothetical protein